MKFNFKKLLLLITPILIEVIQSALETTQSVQSKAHQIGLDSSNSIPIDEFFEKVRQQGATVIPTDGSPERVAADLVAGRSLHGPSQVPWWEDRS
jgi:hypothetical protein